MITGGTNRSVAGISRLAVIMPALALAACNGTQPAGDSSSSASAASSGAASSASATPAATTPSSSASATSPADRPVVVPPPASAKPVADTDPQGTGMVRVQVSTCQGMASAAGSFVADDLVLTTNTVTKGFNAIAVHSSTGVVRGQVVAQDAAHDLAVVKVLPTGDGSRLTGHVFSLAAPAKGAKVTMLGFPVGRHLYRDAGTVVAAGDVFTHTANAAPGTTGGALLDASGHLVGVETSAETTGEHHATNAKLAAALVSRARTAPKTPKAANCPVEGASLTSIHPDAPAIRVALAKYVVGLGSPTQKMSTGQTGLQVAWNTLTDAAQKKYGSAAAFQKSFGGAKPSVANVDNLERTGWSTDTLLWTIQMEGPGSACHVRSQKVVLDSAAGTWQVASVTDTASPRTC